MIVTLLIALTMCAMALDGLALHCLWGWFLAPAFGLPDLPVPHAIGVFLAVALFRRPSAPDATEDDAKTLTRASMHIGASAVCLLLGALVRWAWGLA